MKTLWSSRLRLLKRCPTVNPGKGGGRRRLDLSSLASAITEKSQFEEKNANVLQVKNVFSKMSKNYDKIADTLSFGIQRVWKQELISTLNPTQGTNLLDVAGGTGDVAFRFLDHVKRQGHRPLASHSSVVVCDISEEMLREGQKKAKQLGHEDPRFLRWVCGDALELPFESNSFDAYTIAFGMRNVGDVESALREAYRVLRPGGMFLCLDSARVDNPVLRSLYDWYSDEVIPGLGALVANERGSCEYLVQRIRLFPDQEQFKRIISEAGFTLVEYINLTQGIAAIHTAFKSK